MGRKYWMAKLSKKEKEKLLGIALHKQLWFMQQQYQKQPSSAVTNNLNAVKEIKVGDYLMLGVGDTIYAIGKVRTPRLKKESSPTMNLDEVITQKRKHEDGNLVFYKNMPFYEDLRKDNGVKGEGGQRIDVEEWKCYTEKGINNNGIKSASDIQVFTIFEIKNEDYFLKKLNELEGGNIFMEKLKFRKEIKKFREEIKELLKSNHNLILTGAPGTGKTYLAKDIAADMTGTDGENTEQIAFVQFHPSYDYTDFVEGLRPIKDENGNIGFERKNGIFMDFCKNAVNNPKKNYVFIIDEINRAEPSRVFGELFFSLDPGYRGTKGKVKTQYANLTSKEDCMPDAGIGEFYVPKNVFIIGTMNDIDRSVDSFDFAMRRRFVWKEIKAEDTKDMLSELDKHCDDAQKRMKSLNTVIEEIFASTAYHIGPAYFLKLKNYKRDWKQLWELHLAPLLREYLRGMPEEKAQYDKLKNAYDNPYDKTESSDQ